MSNPIVKFIKSFVAAGVIFSVVSYLLVTKTFLYRIPLLSLIIALGASVLFLYWLWEREKGKTVWIAGISGTLIALFVFWVLLPVIGLGITGDKNLGGDYYVNKKGQVYLRGDGFVYGNDIMEGVDPETFSEISDSLYVKDKNAVFAVKFKGGRQWTSRIESADMPSFVGVGGDRRFGKDKNHVFFTDHIIEGADPSTFVVFGQEKNEVYGGGYAKDKRHVFFEDQTISDRPNLFRYILPHAQYTGDLFSNQGSTGDYYYYVTDGNKVFLNGKKIDGADSVTFEIPFRGVSEIARDAYSIYLKGIKVDGVDVKSFIALEGDINTNGYAKDKNHVYFFGYDYEKNLCIDKPCIVEAADPKTFVLQEVGGRYNAKDAYHYFRDGAVVTEKGIKIIQEK